MDQSFTNRACGLHCLAVLAVVLWMPGCAWFKGQFAVKPAKVPTDPERKEIAESKAGAGKNVAAAADSSSAKTMPVGLDGSATGNGSPATPNAPSLASTQIPASGITPDDPSAGLPDSFDDKSFGGKDRDATAALDNSTPQTGKGSVVAAGSSADSSLKGQTVVTADDRGEDDRAADRRNNDDPSGVDKPEISKSDAALTNENSVFEFEGAGVKLKNGQVAATVNGQPIFLEDIMRQLPLGQGEWLARLKREAPPEEYRKIRQKELGKQLVQHIERELLLQALKSKLKDDALKSIQKQIDAAFNSEGLPHAMKAQGFESETEFEAELEKHGSSIDNLREQFRNRELGQQYLGSKALPKNGFDRPDILKYYQEHKEDYAIHAQAKWEQIRISYSNNGGKEGARNKAEKILERLENDEEFADIARECSDGPTAASKGGLRGWTTQGTLKDKEIERVLYEQPVGEIGPAIETADSIEIVRVIERIPSGYKPFELVQDDIKTTLKNNLWQKATKALIKDLKAKATIDVFIDKL